MEKISDLLERRGFEFSQDIATSLGNILNTLHQTGLPSEFVISPAIDMIYQTIPLDQLGVVLHSFKSLIAEQADVPLNHQVSDSEFIKISQTIDFDKLEQILVKDLGVSQHAFNNYSKTIFGRIASIYIDWENN